MEQAKQGHTAADGQSEPDMLANWLRQLRPRQTLSHGGLRLVLVSARGAVGAPPRDRPLQAALRPSVVTVTETAQAQVPALEVINKGDLPVLLLDGEEVVG